MKGERVAKIMARAGVCSRREAERWIEAGRVALDGKTLTSAAQNIVPGQELRVDGQRINTAEPTRMWCLYKPRGYLVTASDPQKRQTIYDIIPKDLPRMVPVGRLDMNTEGLLLLTNDGVLARALELPANGWPRTYRVRVSGTATPSQLIMLEKGVKLPHPVTGKVEFLQAASITQETKRDGRNQWLTMVLKQGRYREVRRLCEYIGLEVSRLIRTAYGPFDLRGMKECMVREIPQREVRKLQGGTV
ncbi:MAG: rRNA pseudouridine synthase [Rickettsiales bacterium]|nr:rRNA pseudouridine synthase [Rickettsiales bacterium]